MYYNPTITGACAEGGVTITTATGIASSPGYPQYPYGSELTCQWLIKSEQVDIVHSMHCKSIHFSYNVSLTQAANAIKPLN